VLFDPAADDAGFGVDEAEETLGSGIKLAPWYEPAPC
jgi:hypothetical protein